MTHRENSTPDFPTPCYDCEHGGLGFPCRSSEGYDPEKIAAAVLRLNADEQADGLGHEHPDWWAYECASFQLPETAPLVALDLAICVSKMEAPDSAIGLYAAGPLENLFKAAGAKVIDRAEATALHSPRFRYLLSGIWGKFDIDPTVWKRLQIAVRPGPWIDTDARTPQGSAIQSGLYDLNGKTP